MATADNKTKAGTRRYLRLGELLISAGMLTQEQLEVGWRLGCQVYTKGPVTVEILD